MAADFLAMLGAALLLAANAFFVGAEFALISARRDRLEALARAGVNRAVARRAGVVLRAGSDLSRMLAGAQLGITVCSLLLGWLGESAVGHLLDRPMELAGVPQAVRGPISFTVALGIVVVAHMVLGEMVPKNVAIAGPERTALALVPIHVAFVRLTSPLNRFFNLLASVVLRLFGVQPRDELDTAYTRGDLAGMIADSRREGLLDDAESTRLTRTLSSTERTVADVVVPVDEIRTLPAEPMVGDVTAAVAETGFSRFPLPGADGRLTGYLHLKDVLDLADDPSARVPLERVRPLLELPPTARLDEALAALRRSRSHLARVADPSGATLGIVTLEDLVESFVGMISDATHH